MVTNLIFFFVLHPILGGIISNYEYSVINSSRYDILDNNQLIYEIMMKHKDINLQVLDTPAMNMSDYVRFYLYTRKNKDTYQELWLDDDNSVKTSNFNSSARTFFVIHGFLNNINSDAIQLPKKTLLKTYDCNVIGVDWSRIAVTILYNVAAAETSHVGHFLSEMMLNMKNKFQLNLSTTHLVGHSLGAHVAGFAGKNLKGRGLARITGLDPAKPGFTDVGPDGRLSANDANFVDCIHTCAGDLGLDSNICQVDFYPNGGGNPQPGCLSIDFIGTCSHQRSVNLYAESVQLNHIFLSKNCSKVPDGHGDGCTSSQALMGQPATKQYLGIYYVPTHGSYPFAMIVKN